MENSLRTNCAIRKQAAKALLDLKRKGIVTQGWLLLYEKKIERSLKWTMLKTREVEEK